MQLSKTYREYAADCRRIATTMKGADKEILLKMAEAWETRAHDADKKSLDGKGRTTPNPEQDQAGS